MVHVQGSGETPACWSQQRATELHKHSAEAKHSSSLITDKTTRIILPQCRKGTSKQKHYHNYKALCSVKLIRPTAELFSSIPLSRIHICVMQHAEMFAKLPFSVFLREVRLVHNTRSARLWSASSQFQLRLVLQTDRAIQGESRKQTHHCYVDQHTARNKSHSLKINEGCHLASGFPGLTTFTLQHCASMLKDLLTCPVLHSVYKGRFSDSL